MVAAEAINQIYSSVLDQDEAGDADNNETRSARKNNGERIMSLATRKRLEAKAKQDAQTGNANPTIPASPERARHDIQKPRKKPIKPKDTARTDEVDTKARPLGKQDPRYLELHEITPLMNPKQDLSKILTQLRSEDWEANFDAMNTVRRLAIHHAGMIDLSKVHGIVAEILKQVPNLRSSVSKNALLALESMCSAFSRAMDSEVENIIPVLLKRCADSNTFVCESAVASLHTVVLKCSTSRVVSALGAHADSISASKDLPSILQLVGRCLEDSNNEVRDVAKQSVLYMHYEQCMSGERIKRLLPAAAQTKVDSLLRGKGGYVSPMAIFHAPTSSVSEVVTEHSAAPAAKQHETIAASARLKKTAKQHSRRPTPPTSRNVTRSNINADEVSRLETKLDSSNWKDRFDALNETTDFIRGSASALVGSSQMLSLFDQLIKRLDDGNAKVNVLALECMEKIVPAVGTGMEQVLSNFVPAIAKNLANARTSSLAQSVVQQLCTHADNRSLCQHFAIQARNTNSRVLPVVLDTLAQLTAQSCDDKNNYVLNRHVLPLALGLLKEAKSDVKEANAKLLCQLSRTLGLATLSSAASKLSSSQQDKLAAILR
ncbi:TOG array regulator of axonemal microtubules protein 1 [Phytophthora ramorum]|uniref:TOG array regulator of axonemal microtubules protein 1 n=1 Tax=Phytophthora ramorum TaxID=164328 RepID=UPI0030B4F099|nr:TOG array regulator of axonemal microtubules protein 1 [Phytophthora ramorum]